MMERGDTHRDLLRRALELFHQDNLRLVALQDAREQALEHMIEAERQLAEYQGLLEHRQQGSPQRRIDAYLTNHTIVEEDAAVIQAEQSVERGQRHLRQCADMFHAIEDETNRVELLLQRHDQ